MFIYVYGIVSIVTVTACQSIHLHTIPYLCVYTAREPPGDVRFTDVRDGQFVLNWTSVLPTCDRVYYSVTSNCSTCSAGVTNLTTGSCSLPQMWTDGLACAFSVQSVVCGNLIGRSSNPVVVKLQGTCVILCWYRNPHDHLTAIV